MSVSKIILVSLMNEDEEVKVEETTETPTEMPVGTEEETPSEEVVA